MTEELIDLQIMKKEEPFELEPNATSFNLLQAIYRSAAIPISTRMRAAIAALQFEHPKLVVMATIDGRDFGERLDNAVKRSSQIIEAAPAIEDKPKTDAVLKPSIPDRRYRR
jgi:hypothetical protein